MASIEEEQRRRKEQIEISKRKQGQVAMPEPAGVQHDVLVTKKEKMSHFWYYYRTHVLVGVFIAFLIGITVYEIVTREKYDFNVLIATQTQHPSQQEAFEKAVEEYGVDFDQNGLVAANIVAIAFSPPAEEPTESELSSDDSGTPPSTGYVDPNIEMANQTKLMGELSLGETGFFIVDTPLFFSIGGADDPDMLVDLEALYPDVEQVRGNRFYIKGTPFEKSLGLGELPEDFSICIRSLESYKKPEQQETIDRYNTDLAVLDNMIKALSE